MYRKCNNSLKVHFKLVNTIIEKKKHCFFQLLFRCILVSLQCWRPNMVTEVGVVASLFATDQIAIFLCHVSPFSPIKLDSLNELNT